MKVSAPRCILEYRLLPLAEGMAVIYQHIGGIRLMSADVAAYTLPFERHRRTTFIRP